jgi:ribosome-binding protein aMBF1 (putative translation factor)
MANLPLGQLRAKYPLQARRRRPCLRCGHLGRAAGELVYTLRTRAGLTQTELARRMGTTQSSTARTEGGSLPTLGMLARRAPRHRALSSPPAPNATARSPPCC